MNIKANRHYDTRPVGSYSYHICKVGKVVHKYSIHMIAWIGYCIDNSRRPGLVIGMCASTVEFVPV